MSVLGVHNHIATLEAEVERLRKVEREHLGGDEHHKGCARELAFIYEVAGTWKAEVERLRARDAQMTTQVVNLRIEVERLREMHESSMTMLQESASEIHRLRMYKDEIERLRAALGEVLRIIHALEEEA
ncbi:MAG: hypothetical protein ACRDIC_06025 [bacterium]